jgi:hypothetical protein
MRRSRLPFKVSRSGACSSSKPVRLSASSLP